jgi:DNA repair protein RecO (recombination protein O)
VSEQLLPFAEPSEKFFRLLLAVLDSLHHGEHAAWRAVAYFSLWAVRLSGWLPELNVCLSCGTLLDDPETAEHARAYFTRARAGLVCGYCRGAMSMGNTWELSAPSRIIAGEMLRLPVTQLSQTVWSQDTAADLRRFLIQQIESHAERRLVTAPLFNEQGGPNA